MFRIESYITPIIINYVEKYVKNFRPQDAQVSIFSGDVAFQNLDLRLSALEEDLDLPLKFISGHVHELSIHIPWVKLAYEPIVITINTIEFVVQLRDANDHPTTSSVKVQNIAQEPPPGYLASLVKKIVNNISIKCNNIILKYVEEEIVLSCNIQELTFSSADINWQTAFIDVSPMKFLVRKLLKINDLTVCLDKRNSMGKIEICLEPILYRCSLESRIVTKYNFSTREKTSLNRIDIFIKFMDMNISSDQLSMIRRLLDLLRVLPEMKSELDLAVQRIRSESQEPAESNEVKSEGFISWLWNQVPAIFTPEDEDFDQESTIDDEEHIIHFGIYIDIIKVMLKSQEIFNESGIGSVKKVKFTPFMNFEFNGVYVESFRIGKNWQNTQAGISSFKCNFLGDCPCKTFVTVTDPLYSTNTNIPSKYLKGSLFDPDSFENLGLQSKYIANWTSHMELKTESKLLERTGAIAVDMVNFNCNFMSTESNVSFGTTSDLAGLNRKNIIRIFVGPFVLKYCSDLVHRITLVKSYLEAYKFSPYLESKPQSSKNSSSYPTEKNFDSIQTITISIINPSFQFHMWDHLTQSKSDRRKVTKKEYEKLLLPFIEIAVCKINANIHYPLEMLQEKLANDLLFRRTAFDFDEIHGNIVFGGQSFPIAGIRECSLKLNQLIMPELLQNPETIRLNSDVIIKSLNISGNAAQFYLIYYIIESQVYLRSYDVLKTSLLVDIANQHLVKLTLIFNMIIAGYDRTKNYQILQLEIEKLDGYAEILTFGLQTHTIQWPLLQSKNVSKKNFMSFALQLPLNNTTDTHAPIMDLRIEPGGICIDSLFSRFLNYEYNKWAQPLYEPVNMSSKSDTAIVLDTPIRKKFSIDGKKRLQAIPSVHSSSDKEAATSIIEEDENISVNQKETNYIEILKHAVIQIDIGQTTVYFPSKCTTDSIFKEATNVREGVFKENDMLIFSFPKIIIISSVGQIPINTVKLPITIPTKYWSFGKLSFPWNIQLVHFAVSTVQNGYFYSFLQPNKTDVIININDQGPLSVDLHIDMKPIEINLIADQINLITKNLNQFLNLNLIKLLYNSPNPIQPQIDFSTSNHSQVSPEIKEFLSYAQTSWYSNFKSQDSKSDIQSETKTTSLPQKPNSSCSLSCYSYSLLVQFTVSRISLIAFNFDSATKCSNKLIVALEDMIISFNQRPNYHQLFLKITSAKAECFEKIQGSNEFIENKNLGFQFHSDGDVVKPKGTRDAAVLQLMITCADKVDVQTKWKVKIKPNLNSDAKFITEISLKFQQLEVFLDLELLEKFIETFKFDHVQSSDNENIQKTVSSVDDLPLFDFESKGIRIFLPVPANKTGCDVFILTISEIKMIEPENKINRIAVRPDIFHKAQQLGILDIYGTKVENRQYELVFLNISLCTGNWINIVDTLFEQQSVINHDNPALEWNQSRNPPSSKCEIDVKTIFSEFNFGIVYAPSIIFENVLVCQEAVELNCTKDMNISITLSQLILAINIGELFSQTMKTLYPKPKPDIFVLNEETLEYVGVSSNLFKSFPASPKLNRNNSVNSTAFTKKDSEQVFSNSRRVLSKRTKSLIQIEKRSINDSGIESLGANFEKNKLKQKISKLKKQSQIKEIVLMPYEVYFNGGIFIINLYDNDDMVPETSKTYPLLSFFLDRPNIFIKQTNYDKVFKFSLLDFKIDLGVASSIKKNVRTYITVFETRPGESDHTGAFFPFFELKHVSRITRLDDISIKIGKPVKLSFSHKTLDKLLQIKHLVCSNMKCTKARDTPIIPVPVKKENAFTQAKNYVRGINNINLTTTQIYIEISEVNSYDFQLTCAKVKASLNLIERIERISILTKFHSFILTANGETILHPFTLISELTVSHESWKKEPLVMFFSKSNYLQFDLHFPHQKQFLVMKQAFEIILNQYEEKQQANNDSTSHPLYVPEHQEKFIQVVPLKLYSPIHNIKNRQENYEDDLRAGAFQFIDTNSTAELPLPYQIQIYSNSDTSLICWRYPQPRCLSQVKLFPIPIQFNNPTILECKLEYYNSIREIFMVLRNFVLSDLETVNVDIPSRKVCSSIWRITVVQKILKVELDESDEDSDFTERNNYTINDILSQNSFNINFQSNSNFNPKLFVGCLRVDSFYNPTNISTADLVFDFANLQVNIMGCMRKGGHIPKIVKGLKLEGGLIPPHKCISLNISSLLCHASIYENFNVNIDAETELACDIIDYTFMNYTSLIENFKTRLYIEWSIEETKVNIITNTLHIKYGQSVAHALSVLNRIYGVNHDIIEKQQHVTDLILMSRYIICNTTSTDVYFGQFGTSDIHLLSAGSFHLYSLHIENKSDNQIFIRLNDNNILQPINIDVEGIHKRIIGNYIVIVSIQNVSSFQKKIVIAGHVEFYNKTSNTFSIQYKIYTNRIDTTHNSSITELTVDEESNASAIGSIDEFAQESIRIKFSSVTKKSWSGEIPLKETGKNNKPWMVKVPAANNVKEANFWVRIIRENIEEFRVSKHFCPQRVLVIIWPIYSLKSNLTVHTSAYEAAYNQNYSIFGRGEIKEMQMPGAYEDDHELTFKMDFKSVYEEDKRSALLSYKLIDTQEFFNIPSNLKSIENTIKLLRNENPVSWPCKREEELRWNRGNSYQGSTLPIYKFGPTQELSCSLMLTISPWALFINSTSVSIRLKSHEGNESCLIEPNNIVMPFTVESLFEFEVKLHTIEWTRGGLLHINNNFKLGHDSFLIPEEGMVAIVVRKNLLVANFILHSLYEDNMRVFILTTGHVVVNYTDYDLKFWSFAIQTNEKGNGLIYNEHLNDNLYTTEKTSPKALNPKGTPITLFSCLVSQKTKYRMTSTYNYYIVFYTENPEFYSCPLLLNRKIKKKSFSILCDNTYIPLVASIQRYQEQYYISIFKDEDPILAIENLTDFHIFVAQAETLNTNKISTPVNDCESYDNFKWYQQVPSKKTVYYTPPIIDETFPEIENVEYGLIFACVRSTFDLTWSKTVKIDENKEVFLEIPLYGDIKVSINVDGKTIKVLLDYIRQDSEFSAKDIRARLLNPPSLISSNNYGLDTPLEKQKNSFIRAKTNNRKQTSNFLNCLKVVTCVEGIYITLVNNSDKKTKRRREILLLNLDDVTLRTCSLTREIQITFDNFQADNQLYTNGDFDFPVILSSQQNFTSHSKKLSVYELDQSIQQQSSDTFFGDIRIEFYEHNYEGIKGVEIRIKPLRAYIEDSYMMELVDYISDCFGGNALYEVESSFEKDKCPNDRVLIPREVQQTACTDVKTIRLKVIRIYPLKVLLSVHTCLRMYIALDHSPLDFSMFELWDINTLSENLAGSVSMHYLSGAIFGAGWVVGSLEILGSPSGLLRNVSSGVRDFVSMPVQGLLNGPWGFFVGITQGSTSLLKNFTAGTLNSVTKLAASLARNLDRLTLDTEHLQRTDAIRRSRPQGVTEGFTQGLTGLGISLLGALGGLAHHPMQANSPVQVVTGIGKGLVGAVAKPISGAAELLALTGQGVLQSVGFNSLPIPRSLQSSFQMSVETHTTKYHWKQLSVDFPNQSALFACFGTMRLQESLRGIQIVLMKSAIVVFDASYLTKIYTYNLSEISVSIKKEDATHVIITKEKITDEPEFHDEYHVSSRTIQYVQQSQGLNSLPNWCSFDNNLNRNFDDENLEHQSSNKSKDFQVSIFLSESHASHLVTYVTLLKQFTDPSKNQYSPYN